MDKEGRERECGARLNSCLSKVKIGWTYSDDGGIWLGRGVMEDWELVRLMRIVLFYFGFMKVKENYWWEFKSGVGKVINLWNYNYQ